MSITVNVTVKDSKTEKGIEGATVILQNRDNEDTWYAKMTDSEGKATFDNVVKGRYECGATKKGYTEDIAYTDWDSGTKHIEFLIHKSQTNINITVKDKVNSAAVEEASVKMVFDVGGYPEYSGSTDENGKVSFSDIYKGTYKITIEKKGYKKKEESKEFGSETYNISYNLDRNYNIKITSFSSQ